MGVYHNTAHSVNGPPERQRTCKAICTPGPRGMRALGTFHFTSVTVWIAHKPSPLPLGPTPTSLCSSTLARLPLVKTKTLHYSLTAPCVLRSDDLAAFVLEPPTPVQLTAHYHARCTLPRLFHCDSSLLRLCLSLLLLAFFTLAHVSKLGS